MIVIIVIKFVKYEKVLREKNLSIIQFYLDKKFLNIHLSQYFSEPRWQNYTLSFLDNIKFYFKLDDIRIISEKELENDQELSSLFKKELEGLWASVLADTKKDATSLYQVINIDNNNTYRLYIYLPHDRMHVSKEKTLVYIKAPYIFAKDEVETLDIYVHLAKLFFERAI
jgi:hypothetical protein